jgi:O-acetylhomoserine (thiol)-lyase
VAKTNFPGLAAHGQHGLAKKLFKLPGALLSFELREGVDTFACLNRLKLGVKSSNLGDSRTLVIPVAQTIFWELGPQKRAEMGIAESLVRVSVGFEDTEDLLEDFESALKPG